MHLYFDESGDFGFPADSYDVYVQAGFIVPDSFVGKVEHYVANKKDELGMKELHATELADEELVVICEWLNSGPLSLVGQATDTAVMTAAQLRDYRQEQAARLVANLEQYMAAGGRWAGAEAWYTRHIKRAELSSRVSDSEYIQAHMLVGLIHAALFKSIVRYIDESWRNDLVDFHFILELPDKLAAGEKDLDVLLVPLLGSNDYELVVPNTWGDEPVHPWSASQWYIAIGSPGSRTLRLMPSCGNSVSPWKSQIAPRPSPWYQRASRALRTNQPSPLGTSPCSVVSSGASGTTSESLPHG